MKLLRNRNLLGYAVVFAIALASYVVQAQNPGDALERGFQNPPDSAKPRVWWHWMNGNIAKEGIKLDLEWMKRIGIGGFQNFDAALNTPQVVEKRLVYMTPEWKDAFNYAATLADQMGLEMAIAGSPGWSESGGPWVPPSQAMKKFVWSETRVEGGRPFTGTLAQPPSQTGPFQNMSSAGRGGMGGTAAVKPPQPFYADAELAMGLNRFVIHTSVHQPVTEKMPGLGLGPFGQWFTRQETWAEYAGPWMTYLARSSFVLQQGKFVADIIYYYGEDSNITALFGNAPPDLPAGYNFDYANSDVILNRLAVTNGRLTTTTGMSYRILALDPNSRHMPLAVLRKIRDLVNAGAVVAGPKPMDSPSLADDQAEFGAIAEQLWGSAMGERIVGSGRVFAGQTAAQTLAALKVDPDFDYVKPQADTNLLFVHRKLDDGEIYWVNNRNNRMEILDATFRIQGKAAEIWHPDTGVMEPASYEISGARTIVPLRLDPNDAFFVVFRKAAGSLRLLPVESEAPVATIAGAWDVSFQVDRGAPAKIVMDSLSSWSDSADDGVKYFSGTGTYTKTIQAPAGWFKQGTQMWLDRGEVKNIAEISVNGKALGVVWKKPFRANVTGAIQQGPNTIVIKVTNLWLNRIVGDQQPNATRKYTYTSQQFYRADTPLLPSGLLGPVRIVRSGT